MAEEHDTSMRGIKEDFEEICMLQKRYIYALKKINNETNFVENLDLFNDLFLQIDMFLLHIFHSKIKYFGRTLDWAEEYANLVSKTIQEDMQNGAFDKALNLVPSLINYMQKSNEEFEEILQIGLYNVDLGQMHFKENEAITSKEEMIQAIDPDTMNPLENFFFNKNHNVMTKWCHYFEVYHRHFEQYRDKPVTILEIGVFGGGSLQMWKDYFGTKCNIIGVDIMEECKNYEEDRIKIYIGSQEDRTFLQKIKKEIGHFDIIIDDGGHTMRQQITTFEELYPCLSPNGVYLCEDVMTSYWPKYGGGYNNTSSFIEYSKNFIDQLNARYSLSENLKINEFTQSIRSIHYYDSMIVFEKGFHRPAMVI